MSTLKVGEIKNENFTGTTQLKLDNSGRLLLGTTTEGHANADDLTVSSSGDTGLTIRSGTSNLGNIYFSDATSGDGEYRGIVQYEHANDKLNFGTAAATRLSIDSSGDIGLGTTTPNLAGYSSPVTSIGKSGNPYAVLELQGTQTSDGAMGLITGYNTSGSSRIATINWNRDGANNSGSLSFETASSGTLGERMRIDSSGKVGIGTNSPTEILHIKEGTNKNLHFTGGIGQIGNVTGFYAVNDANNAIVDLGMMGDTLRFATGSAASGAERMRINSDGDVLIGRTSTIDTSEVLGIKGPSGDNCTFGVTCNGTTQAGIIAFNDDDANFRGRVQYNHNGDSMVFHTASTERVRIDNEGMTKVCSESHALGVSTTASSGTNKYCFRGHHSGTNGSPASGTLSFTVWSNGNVENLNNSYGQISDETLKQDIVDASSQWNDIKNITVRKFRFKDNPTGNLQIGVVAQEVEKVSAGLVYETGDVGKEVKAVKYSVLHMKAVKALQEAQVRIETLETKVAALEAK